MIKLLTKKNYYELIEYEKPEYIIYNWFDLKGITKRIREDTYDDDYDECVYFIESFTGTPFVYLMELKKLLIPKKYSNVSEKVKSLIESSELSLENWKIEFLDGEKNFITNNYHRKDYDHCKISFEDHKLSMYPNYKRGNYKITNVDFPEDSPIEFSLWDNQEDEYIFRDYIYIGSELKDSLEISREEKSFMFNLIKLLITEWIIQMK